MSNTRIFWNDGAGHFIATIPLDWTVEEAIENLPPDATNVTVGTVEDWAACDPDTWHVYDPADNACEIVNGKPAVNMTRARGLHMKRIRAARDAELARIDNANKTKLARVGAGIGTPAERDAVAQLEAQKQVLRDIPQTFDLSTANTPNELKALWPVELPR